MINKFDVISSGTSVVTATYSIAYFKETLSIIILVISILNILFNMGYKIYKKVKEKRYAEISVEIEKTKEELEKINNELENKGGK